MRNSIFAAAALSASMLSACNYDSQSDGVETPGAEVSNPVEEEMQETGESLRDAADNAAEEIEAASEEEAADLMVPMLTLSGLFDDEDFQKVRNSEKLSRQMADAIPDSLTDLYLLFHAPD